MMTGTVLLERADKFVPRACTKCGVVKDRADYMPNKRHADGYTRRCRACAQRQSNDARKRRVAEVGWVGISTVEQRREAGARYRKNNPEAVRRRWFRNRYGITPEDHAAMLVAQDNRCAICRDVLDKPVVDHDHETGKVREILCHPCNIALGMTRDDPERLRAAAAYIERHRP